MADKRLYTIPLRDAWNVSIKKRSKRAMAVIRAFTEKHMKAESVKIGSDLNHLIWSRGIKNPPRKVKIQMVPHRKDDIETIWVDLATSSMDYLKEKKEEKPKPKKKEEAEPAADKKPEIKEVAEAKPEADKKPEDKAEKKAEPKATEAKAEKAEPVKEKAAEKEKPKPAKKPKAEKPKEKKAKAKPKPVKK